MKHSLLKSSLLLFVLGVWSASAQMPTCTPGSSVPVLSPNTRMLFNGVAGLTNYCYGNTVSANAGLCAATLGIWRVFTTNDDCRVFSGGWVCDGLLLPANCTWTASVWHWNTNGMGTNAVFLPASIGTGTLTFHMVWTNTCDGTLNYTNVSGSFNVTNSPGQDSDGDGLPDAWEWKYFGSLAESATNLDAEGKTLGDDYTNGVDLSDITFSIEAANDYVNYSNVSVQLDLTAGEPAYCALFINSSTTTNWLPFTTTNLNVNLGATDGVYTVNVGLKALPDDAQPSWASYSFTLDRVAPLLTVTNPAGSTVIKPYLQLQGYANEQLSSLSYDISNAAGLVTNQDAFVTDQYFDTNAFDFTTNYFQAYDVPLATNGNLITLRVTDRAGNTTTTNFNVTLDYSGATNPVMALTWPPNGVKLCGSSFTLRGWVDDETATVAATITDTNGDTNTVIGEVERSGVLWAENLPLNEGTNWVTLWLTNAAGLASVTNLMVIKSEMTLTIDSIPTGDALWQSFGSVSGHISDTAATVFVNGVQGTNYGDGTWRVDKVPISASGVASFDVNAVPVGGDDPLINTNVEKGAYMNTVLYHYKENEATSSQSPGHGDTLWTWSWDKTCQATMPTNGSQPFQSGSGIERYTAKELNPDEYSQKGGMDCAWSDNEDGFFHITNSMYGVMYDDYYYPQWDFDGDPEAIYDEAVPQNGIYYADTSYSWNGVIVWEGGTEYTAYDRLMSLKVKTQVKLFTGGKATVARQSLFGISCVATELQQPFLGDFTWPWAATMPCWPSYLEYQWLYEPTAPIDLTTLTVLNKHLGADGKLWLALPDNSVQDITITIPGKKHFSASATPQKYKPYIQANGIRLDPDTIVSNAEFCVGQKIIFTLQFDPIWPDTDTIQNNWVLPAKYVNANKWFNAAFPPDGSGNWEITTCDPVTTWTDSGGYGVNGEPYCTTYVSVNWPLTQLETGAWWVSGGPKSVSCYPTLNFNNGQKVSLIEHGDFTVFRPSVTFPAAKSPINQSIIPMMTNGWLQLGNPINRGGDDSGLADFNAEIDSKMPFTGVANWTQLIKRSVNSTFAGNTGGIYDLDTGRFYNSNNDAHIWLHTGVSASPDPWGIMALNDSPGVVINWTRLGRTITIKDDFNTYLEFKPVGDSIWVTLGIVTWGWGGTENSSVLSSPSTVQPWYQDSDQFPLWTQVWTP